MKDIDLRDYFAAKALPALIRMKWDEPGSPDGIVVTAYILADALLEARKMRDESPEEWSAAVKGIFEAE